VDRGIDPMRERKDARAAATVAAANTLAGVVAEFFAKEGPRLRSRDHRMGVFRNHILPDLGARPIGSIRRGDVAKLLDRLESEISQRTASLTLAYLNKLFRWYALRNDDFVNPIVPGMARGSTTRRERILTDAELQAYVWAAEAWDAPQGRYLLFLLYTACRRDEAGFMTWEELSADHTTWTIPKTRHKSGWRKDASDVVLPLSAAAQSIIAQCPRIRGNDLVFATGGSNPGYLKVRADVRMSKEFGGPVPHWTLHDIRRTARSLMARAGVRPDHAERAVGHVIAGVEGVYDRHSYEAEKLAAFEALAALVDRIVTPIGAPNVVPLRTGA
jgi:integrase